MPDEKNVLGGKLEPCCKFPMTGFFRDGSCRACEDDPGEHLICAEMTKEFLAFSKVVGNDLTLGSSAMDFPGLIPGDRWCLCVARWQEAEEAGVAPPVVLEATHEDVLNTIPLDVLKEYAVDPRRKDPFENLKE